MRGKFKTTFPANFGMKCVTCGQKPSIDARTGAVRCVPCGSTEVK